MLTTCELLQIQDGQQGKNTIQVVPILESTKLSKLEGPGIEINIVRNPEIQPPKKEKLCKGFCFKHPGNNGIWFQIRNATNISHLIKIFDNKTIWKQQCVFPCHAITACYSNNVIVVSLCDNTLNFIDSVTGCPCLPPIFLSNGTKYLQRIGNDKIALLTNTNQLIIWEIDPNTLPKCLIKVNFYGVLDKIRYIEVTQELETKELSPIIQTETKRYRYSVKRQCWTLPEFEYKTPFSKVNSFETLDGVITSFGYSLLIHDQPLMEKTYLIMLNETPYECVLRLINYYNVGIKEVSGIWLCDVLKHAFDHLLDHHPDIAKRVTESKEYKLYAPDNDEDKEQDINNENQMDNDDDNIDSSIPMSGNNITGVNDNLINANSNNIIPQNNSADSTLNLSADSKQTKCQPRKVPTVELDSISKRNSFDENLFSQFKNNKELFYRFNTKFDNYIKRANIKDPKISKFIEAFSYSSNEQKEIAHKLKLKLPSSTKRRSNSTDNINEETKKKKKRRFIKPELYQKKPSHQNQLPQHQLLLTSAYQQPGQQMQNIQQIQSISNIPIQFQFLQNRNTNSLQLQPQSSNPQIQSPQMSNRQILQQQQNQRVPNIYSSFFNDLIRNPRLQQSAINKPLKQQQKQLPEQPSQPLQVQQQSQTQQPQIQQPHQVQIQSQQPQNNSQQSTSFQNQPNIQIQQQLQSNKNIPTQYSALQQTNNQSHPFPSPTNISSSPATPQIQRQVSDKQPIHLSPQQFINPQIQVQKLSTNPTQNSQNNYIPIKQSQMPMNPEQNPNQPISIQLVPNPQIPNQQIPNPQVPNPQVSNPQISNQQSPKPQITNHQIPNPQISNQHSPKPQTSNQQILNQQLLSQFSHQVLQKIHQLLHSSNHQISGSQLQLQPNSSFSTQINSNQQEISQQKSPLPNGLKQKDVQTVNLNSQTHNTSENTAQIQQVNQSPKPKKQKSNSTTRQTTLNFTVIPKNAK